MDTYDVTTEALRIAREERRPVLVEAVTYRFRGHSMADPEEYRTKEQVDAVAQARPARGLRRPARRGGHPRRRRARADGPRDDRARRRRGRVRRRLAVPVAQRPLRRHLRPRRPGPRLVLRRRAHADPAPRRGRARDGPRRPAALGRARPRAARTRRSQPTPPQRGARTERDGRHALPRGAQRGAARGDGARRERHAHGRGHRRLQRRLQGDRRACSTSSARSACATRRSPRTRSSAWASAPR